MFKTSSMLATLSFLAFLALPHSVLAQRGSAGIGSALSNDAMMHQGKIEPGISDTASKAARRTPDKIIKDIKVGMKDADPLVRVAELTKLRTLEHPEVNGLLLKGLADRDIRVKMKAIDVIGARETNAAVHQMAQMLFLRSTEYIVKLHLVAALGRIGDSRGTLPVMEFLKQTKDERARGTAVFALGEIGDQRATRLLTRVVEEDKSQMVERLAKEAIQKIDGELPSFHRRQLAAENVGHRTPTDQRLNKLREFDRKRLAIER